MATSMDVSRLLHRKVSSPLSAGVLLSVNMERNGEGKGEKEDFFVACNDKNIELWGLRANKNQVKAESLNLTLFSFSCC